jgi:hypothetical protein
MQKLIFSMILLFVLNLSLSAQIEDKSQNMKAQQYARLTKHAQPDQLEYKGYIISVQNALGGNYGYDISKEGKVLISQRRNPFNNSPVGLRSKDDVIKVAKWQISQFTASTQPTALMNAPLPKNLHRELNIPLK